MWTIIWFAARDTLADQLAAALAAAPESRGWWYCDFHSDSQVTVVFAGRVFRYQRGKCRRPSRGHGLRAVGRVPEPQLD